MRDMSDMSFYGTILVQYSKEHREELKDAGDTKCYVSLEKIKVLAGIYDVWFTKSGDADIVIWIKVLTPADAEKLKEQISSIDGITNVRLRLSVEAQL